MWNPDKENQKGFCAEVEKVQRRATKMLGHLKNLPYPERLRRLKLPCLEHRRKRGDIIEVYKYRHGFYKVSRPDFHIARNMMRSTRGNSLKLLKLLCKQSGEPLEQPPGQCGNSTIGRLLQEKTGQALGSISFNVRPRMPSLNCDINDLFGTIPDHRGQFQFLSQ